MQKQNAHGLANAAFKNGDSTNKKTPTQTDHHNAGTFNKGTEDAKDAEKYG